MATRGKYQYHTIKVDDEEVKIRYRRFSALDSALEAFDASADFSDLHRHNLEFDRLSGLEEPSEEDSDSMRKSGVLIRALQTKIVDFVHRNIISVEGLKYERKDGNIIVYDDCKPGEQDFLIRDCWNDMQGFIALIRNTPTRDELEKEPGDGGLADPEKSESLDRQWPLVDTPDMIASGI